MIKNKAKFAQITRDELVQILSLDTQSAIYCSLPAERKYEIWKAKFQKVINTMGLAQAENAHIQTAIDYFQPQYWESNESLDNYRPWADNWGAYAMQNFGWDSTKLFLVAETWLMPEELNTIANHYNNTPHVQYIPSTGDDDSKPDCTCRYSVSCEWFKEKCGDGDCKAMYTCGISGSSKCTGYCIDAASVSHPHSPDSLTIPQNPPKYYIH